MGVGGPYQAIKQVPSGGQCAVWGGGGSRLRVGGGGLNPGGRGAVMCDRFATNVGHSPICASHPNRRKCTCVKGAVKGAAVRYGVGMVWCGMVWYGIDR